MIHASEPNPLTKPIGYWLKLLDGLIESAFDGALAEQHVARRHWQALNVLASGPQDTPALDEALRPFWAEGAITIEQVVDDLQRRGWIEPCDGGFGLTPQGETARAAIAERVTGVRGQMMSGLEPDEYESTVNTLARMAGNLRTPLT